MGWITIDEAARRAGVSRVTVRNWILAGRLRSGRQERAFLERRKIFRQVGVVDEEDLNRVVAQRTGVAEVTVMKETA